MEDRGLFFFYNKHNFFTYNIISVDNEEYKMRKYSWSLGGFIVSVIALGAIIYSWLKLTKKKEVKLEADTNGECKSAN